MAHVRAKQISAISVLVARDRVFVLTRVTTLNVCIRRGNVGTVSTLHDIFNGKLSLALERFSLSLVFNFVLILDKMAMLLEARQKMTTACICSGFHQISLSTGTSKAISTASRS